MLFRPEKWSSKKLLKNRNFAKGLIHGFCQKIDLFLICFFWAKKARKKHFLIFWIENKAFWTSKVMIWKSRKKSTFCKGVSSWFLSKNRPFPHMFFWSKKKQKETFFHILDRKECVLDKKEQFQKTLKNRHFAKGLVQGFCQKIDLFLISFFLSKKARKKHSFYILDRK